MVREDRQHRQLRRLRRVAAELPLRFMFRPPVLFLMVAFLFVFQWQEAAVEAAPAMVRLRSHTTIDHDTIRLRDLAETITCKDAGLQLALETVVIGKAPEPGIKRVVSRELVRHRVAAAHVDLQSLQLMAPAEMIVTRGGQVLSPEAVREAIEEFVRSHGPGGNDRIRITTIRFSQTLLPAGLIELRVPVRSSVRWRDRFFLTLEAYQGKRRLRSILVEVQAEVWVDVAVAKRAMARNELITEETVRIEPRHLTQLPADTLLDTQGLLGASLRAPIAEGQPFNRRHLVRLPLVGRGDVVTLFAEGERFRISTKAKARAPGKYGERIEVMNLDSGKTLQAEVTGPRQVRAR